MRDSPQTCERFKNNGIAQPSASPARFSKLQEMVERRLAWELNSPQTCERFKNNGIAQPSASPAQFSKLQEMVERRLAWELNSPQTCERFKNNGIAQPSASPARFSKLQEMVERRLAWELKPMHDTNSGDEMMERRLAWELKTVTRHSCAGRNPTDFISNIFVLKIPLSAMHYYLVFTSTSVGFPLSWE